MREHLSEEQLNHWILGQAGSDATEHLEACATCRREAEELKQALDGFHDSIHGMAEGYRLRWPPVQPERSAWTRLVTERWGYAVALAAILVVSVFLLRFDHRRRPHPVAGTIGESEILMQIQADVSEDVPSALEPGELLLAAGEQPPPPAKPAGKAPKSSPR